MHFTILQFVSDTWFSSFSLQTKVIHNIHKTLKSLSTIKHLKISVIWIIISLILPKTLNFNKMNTMETQYNEIFGTEKLCLLYQIFCYISIKKQYKTKNIDSLGPEKLSFFFGGGGGVGHKPYKKSQAGSGHSLLFQSLILMGDLLWIGA